MLVFTMENIFIVLFVKLVLTTQINERPMLIRVVYFVSYLRECLRRIQFKAKKVCRPNIRMYLFQFHLLALALIKNVF